MDDRQGPAAKPDEYPGDGKNANYSEGVLVGYRWYDAKNQTPLFPFGFGLSYTSFKYGAGRVEAQKNGDTRVSVRIANTGKREGAEVAQLYVEFPTEAGEPPHQLKGFERVNLRPGESREVALNVTRESLAAWDEGAHDWKIYPGTYRVFVGGSSRGAGYRGEFKVAK